MRKSRQINYSLMLLPAQETNIYIYIYVTNPPEGSWSIYGHMLPRNISKYPQSPQQSGDTDGCPGQEQG